MRIAYKYFIILILGLVISCKDKQKLQNKVQEVLTPFPCIVDSQKVKRFSFDDENPTWLSTAFYELNYIGKLKDTVSLENAIKFSFYNPETKNEIKDNHMKYYIDWLKKVSFKNWENSKIEIQIGEKSISNSLPVLIRNNNKDTIAIGYGSQIPIVMEALNEKKEWKPIQEKFIYMCGNGVGTIVLPPGEIAITLAPFFKGKQKTKLRLVYGDNKSKQFWGYINKRQFESKFDGGDFKDEYKKENPHYNDF